MEKGTMAKGDAADADSQCGREGNGQQANGQAHATNCTADAVTASAVQRMVDPCSGLGCVNCGACLTQKEAEYDGNGHADDQRDEGVLEGSKRHRGAVRWQHEP